MILAILYLLALGLAIPAIAVAVPAFRRKGQAIVAVFFVVVLVVAFFWVGRTLLTLNLSTVKDLGPAVAQVAGLLSVVLLACGIAALIGERRKERLGSALVALSLVIMQIPYKGYREPEGRQPTALSLHVQLCEKYATRDKATGRYGWAVYRPVEAVDGFYLERPRFRDSLALTKRSTYERLRVERALPDPVHFRLIHTFSELAGVALPPWEQRRHDASTFVGPAGFTYIEVPGASYGSSSAVMRIEWDARLATQILRPSGYIKSRYVVRWEDFSPDNSRAVLIGGGRLEVRERASGELVAEHVDLELGKSGDHGVWPGMSCSNHTGSTGRGFFDVLTPVSRLTRPLAAPNRSVVW